jgi:hypothetical protein
MEKNAKKRLAFDHVKGNPKETLTLALTNCMHVDGDNINKVVVEEDDKEKKDKKRHKGVDGTSVSNTSSGSAASLEGVRREQ